MITELETMGASILQSDEQMGFIFAKIQYEGEMEILINDFLLISQVAIQVAQWM